MLNSFTQNNTSIMDQLPGYFILKTAGSVYTYANNNAANILGFSSPAELIGKTDHDLKCYAAEYANGFIEEDKLTLKHGRLKFISHFCYAKDEWKTCIYEKAVLRDEANVIMGISCYVTDITNCPVADITQFLLKTDEQYHYALNKKQFSYLLDEGHLNNDLSTREAECLFFILRGKSSKSIAKILNLSVKTVEYYTEQLKFKIGCYNKSELIEKSLAKGYLYLIPKSLLNSASS